MSTQRHYCDFCDDYIWPGDMYDRWLRANRYGLRVMRLHFICTGMRENERLEMEREHVEARVSIAFELKIVQRLAVLVNGETVVESSLVCEPVAVTDEHDESQYEDLDDEIAF